MIRTCSTQIKCDDCRKDMDNGHECYCRKCFGKRKEEVVSAEMKTEFVEKQIEEYKEKQRKKLRITKPDLKRLYKSLCKHKEHYKKGEGRWDPADWSWAGCKDCCLRFIDWPTTGGHCVRDLCFAIWHEGILDRTLRRAV